MQNRTYLLKYAIEYLSKFSSSKNNLERILKSKIQRLTKDKKNRFNLYKEIDYVFEQLEKNNLLDDKNYSFIKIQLFSKQGKSKNYVKKYLFSKGIESSIIQEQLNNFEIQNPEWEKKSARIFLRKKNLVKFNNGYEKKLAKMARAGFSYDLCKEILD